MVQYMATKLGELNKECQQAEKRGEDSFLNYLEGAIEAYEHLIEVAKREDKK